MAKDTTLALSKDELVLLQQSEEAKDDTTYGNLFEVIKKYSKLKKYDVEFGEFNDTAKLVLNTGKDSLFKNVSSEWSALKFEEVANTGQIVKCQLCGTKNTRIFYIVNNKNDTILHIGSHCIEKFTGIRDIAKVKKSFKDSNKLREEIQRNNAFLTKCPNADQFVKKARKDFVDFDILLPWNLYEVLDKETNILSDIYKNFKNKGNIKDIEIVVVNFSKHKETYNKLWKEANQIKEQACNSIYICRKREYQWLIDNSYHDLLMRISKEGGYYTSDTIGEVYSHDFINELIPIIKECCEDTGLELIVVSYENKELIFHLNDNIHRDYLEIRVSEKNFMRHIGWKCCFIKYYKMEIIPNIFFLSATKHNIEVIISRLNRVLPITKENFKYNYDDEKDEFYIEKGIDSTYKLLDTKTFLQKYLTHISKSEIQLSSIYLNEFNFLKKNPNWRKLKDREEFQSLKKLMAKDK